MASSYLKVSQASISGLPDELSAITTSINNLNNAALKIDSNLSDVANTADARTNLDVYSTGETDTAINSAFDNALEIANNLSDLADASTARSNLDVYSTSETDSAISAAVNGLAAFKSAETYSAMMALTGVVAGSFVTVSDDGDGKWARYEVLTVNGSGTPLTVEKRNDQDSLENAISGADIASAYESVSGVNRYTDADKAKVGHISVTSAIDLDKVVQNDELKTDLTASGLLDTDIPSALAVKTALTNSVSSNALLPALQTLTVSASNTITVSNAPKNGITGIMNFGLVEYAVDASTSEFARVTAVSGSTITVSDVPSGSLIGKQVTIQYVYTAA